MEVTLFVIKKVLLHTFSDKKIVDAPDTRSEYCITWLACCSHSRSADILTGVVGGQLPSVFLPTHQTSERLVLVPHSA